MVLNCGCIVRTKLQTNALDVAAIVVVDHNLKPCLTHTHIEKPMSGFDEVFVLVLARRELVIYLNAFSGEASIEFPSTLQMARGGVCFLRS